MAKKKAEAGGEDDLTKAVLDHVATGGESTDAEKQEQARALLRAFNEWEQTKEWSKTERARVNENVAQQAAFLKDAMEAATTTSDAERLQKLHSVEVCWQDWEEAKAEQKDIRSSTRDNLKVAEQKIRDLLEESKQLGLTF